MRAPLSLLLAIALIGTGCRDGSTPPVSGTTALDSADQVMFGIRTFLTDKGVRKAQLRADTAYFFDDNSRIELLNVHTTFFDNSGAQSSVLTSNEGTYNTRLAMTEARDSVVVVTNDGRRLTTAQLRYTQGSNQITSDSAFVYTTPTQRLVGKGFVSDPDMKNIRVFQVKEGEGGAITLPGQRQ